MLIFIMFIVRFFIYVADILEGFCIITYVFLQ